MPAYELFSSTDVLSAMALERMMAKLSTRRYAAGLEPVGAVVEATGRSTSKSAISRRFVAATESALADMLAADLTELDLVALMIDGVHFADHLCVVALGIGIDGTKHPLGLAEGDTENTTVVRDLLADLRHAVPSDVARRVDRGGSKPRDQRHEQRPASPRGVAADRLRRSVRAVASFLGHKRSHRGVELRTPMGDDEDRIAAAINGLRSRAQDLREMWRTPSSRP